jgi:NADH dehydrogenase FAD-containing subunit
LAAARALRAAPVDVILLDRSNHHLFQPLLYQVATSVLAEGQIASPIRNILRKQRNTAVILGEVTGIDKVGRRVFAKNVDREGVAISYDYLVLATGAHHSYFGHGEFERFAPGLKTAADAVMIRNRILAAFERAEALDDPKRPEGLLTFVLVGAGPTGVEMAGAIAVLIRQTLRSEFRRINPASARIVLVEGGGRLLSSFSEPLSLAAATRLESLGVEIRPGHVDRINEEGAWVGPERIPSKTVIWAAGVAAAAPVGKWLEVETDRAGRIRIDASCRVPGHPEVFVIGDAASLDRDGQPLPGVAQVAMQQGRYAGDSILKLTIGGSQPPPFQYFDKGNMAVVGKGFAILESGQFKLSGSLAWLAWAMIHISFLAQSGFRISVFLQWIWTFLTGQRGSRLIVNHHTTEGESHSR